MSDSSRPIFISPEALEAERGAPDVQIVAVDAADDYAAVHIPGAVRLGMDAFTATDGATGGLIPDEAMLAARLSEAGLRNDCHIVAYDRVGDGPASRLCYTLDAMGHHAFSVLDGGLGAWQQAGLPTESGTATVPSSNFRLDRDAETIADRDWITAHLDDPDAVLLDVRSPAEYTGEDVRSARGGHIPGAVNLDWRRLKNNEGRLLDTASLRALLADHGVRPESDVTAYCQTHVRSSYAYLVLKALGYPHVRGYPGAWSDWGNQTDTPVAH